MRRYRLDIGWRHVHRDGFNFRPRAFQPLPERFQCVRSFAFAHENHRSGIKVHDERAVAMPLGDRDFIDGNAAQPFQLWLPKPTFDILLLDIFDDVPADTQMACNVLYGLRLAQLAGVSLKVLGVGSTMVGKWNMNLANDVARLAEDSWDRQDNERRARSDWE